MPEVDQYVILYRQDMMGVPEVFNEAMSYVLWYVAHDYAHHGCLFN